MQQPKNIPFPPVLALKQVCVALFWGGTFIAGRVLAQSMPLMTAAAGRFLIASLLLVWAAFKLEGGLPRLSLRQLGGTALLGFTGIFLYNVFFFGALARIPAGRTALFVSLSPVLTALCAAALLGERLGRVRWLGIAVALSGAAIVITRGDFAGAVRDITQSVGAGEIMMMCAVLSWVAYTLLSRRMLAALSPIAAMTYGSLWGFLFLTAGAALETGAAGWPVSDWRIWAAMLYMGVFGTVVAFLWYYQGIREVGPSRTVVFTNLVPLFGVLLSALLLGEAVSASMLVGGALSVLGVILVNRR